MMKKFTHEVVNLRISLHILSKKVKKVYTEQTCVNLCKLRPWFTHICPPMSPRDARGDAHRPAMRGAPQHE